MKPTEASVAGAEIVERDCESDGLEVAPDRGCPLHIVEKHRFGTSSPSQDGSQ